MLKIFQNPSPTEPRRAEISAEQQALLLQLQSETEQRIFLEQAIELVSVDAQSGPSDVTQSHTPIASLLDLLNRIAGAQRVLLIKDGPQSSAVFGLSIIESSCFDEQDDFRLDSDWLRRLVVSAKLQRVNQSRLGFDRTALILPITNTPARSFWLVAIGTPADGGDENSSPVRTLGQQKALFRTAAAVLGRFVQ